MAMKGRPLVKQGYEQELSSIRAFVSMQNKSDSSGGASSTDHGVSSCTVKLHYGVTQYVVH